MCARVGVASVVYTIHTGWQLPPHGMSEAWFQEPQATIHKKLSVVAVVNVSGLNCSKQGQI